ncbi:MAG: response regulator [Thermotogaceae bacterium]|nr:response regulator [Thermotogaceae bacterium]
MRFSKYLLILSCLFTVVGFAVVFNFFARDREREISRSYQELKGLTSVIERQILIATADIESLLKYIRKEAEGQRDLTKLRMLLLNLAALYEDRVNLLVITDREGNLLTSSQIPFQELNIGDRSFFNSHKNSGSREMLISHPLLGRATNKTFIPMSLRIQDEGNVFAGITLSSTKPEYFQTFFNSGSSDPDLIMLLVLESGDVLATSGIEDTSSLQLFNNRVFQETISGRDLGKAFHRFVDDKSRIVVSGKIGTYPLYFFIAKEESAVLSQHRSRVRFATGFASSLLAVLFFVNWIVYLAAKKASVRVLNLEREASESLLFFEKIPEGVWDWKVEDHKITFNAPLYELLGYDRVESASDLNTWKGRIHPEDLPLVEKAHQRHRELKQAFSLEYRLKLKNGDWRWVSAKGVVVKTDEAGNPSRMIGTITDAQPMKDLAALADTEREAVINAESRVEELIRCSEDKALFLETFLQGLRTVQEPFPLSVTISKLLSLCMELTDAKDGYFALLNKDQETQRILAIESGFRSASALQFPVKISESEREAYKGKCIHYDEGVEIGWMREPGNLPVFLENVVFTPILTRGETIGLLGLGNRVKGFKPLGKTFLETFALIFSVAYEIHLRREEHMALRFRQEETEQSRNLEKSGGQKEVISLAELIKEVVDALPKEILKSVRIRYDIHHDVPTNLVGDSVSIKQILTYLLEIVIEKRTREEVVVSAYQSQHVGEEGQNTCWIDIVVHGMANEAREETISKMGERIQQSSIETEKEKRILAKEVQKAKKMAGRVGGKVELQAEKGMGIIVTLKLPFTASETSPKEAILLETIPENELAGLTILVAEDDPINRRIIKALLERRGCHVLEAKDGAQTVELWRTRPVNLILMDIRMPKIDGYEATKLIREEEKAKGSGNPTPIIALTAYAMQEDKNKCVALGMDEHVSKPIQKEELLTKILLLTDRTGIC